MKKFKSTMLGLTIIVAVFLAVSPIQVRADSSGPQDTSTSRPSGGSPLTWAQIAAMIIASIHF